MRQALDPEHREPVLLVVIAGVVAERAFQRVQVAADLLQRHAVLARAGEAGLARAGCGPRARTRRARAPAASRRPRRRAQSTTSVRLPRSRPANWYSRERVRHRRDGAEHRRRVGAERHRDRKRLARIGASANSRKSSAPPRCASQRMISLAPADHLLAVDAEVLAQARLRHAARAARDDQAPGDQRARVPGPAGLDRQPAEIDLVGRLHHLLARRALRTTAGFMSHSALRHLSTACRRRFSPWAAPAPCRLASRRPMSRSSETSAAPMPSATRRGVPKRLASTGIV